MIVFPNAKINLGLNVTTRRPDGYHDLVTVMVPAPWRDVLEVVPGRGTSHTLTVTGRTVDCPPEKNLVMKAVRALESVTGALPPLDIYLHKVIPDGAGLGGGSSDAAFVLKAVNGVLRLSLDDATLTRVAARVGADCPFFIYNRPSLCTGTGTDVRLLGTPLPEGLTLLIAKPVVTAVSTAAAYAGIVPRQPEHEPEAVLRLPVAEWRGRLVNDFETTIFKLLPEVALLRRRLYDSGALYASMSGSGAAVYGLYADAMVAQSVADSLSGCDTCIGQFGAI